MPIYEYRCRNGHTFDVMQRMSDGPATECQVCGAPVERVFRAPAVHFKGSGFYNTDYGTRQRAREQRESSDSSANGSSSSGDSAAKGSESKGSESKSSGSEKSTASTSGSSS